MESQLQKLDKEYWKRKRGLFFNLVIRQFLGYLGNLLVLLIVIDISIFEFIFNYSQALGICFCIFAYVWAMILAPIGYNKGAEEYMFIMGIYEDYENKGQKYVTEYDIYSKRAVTKVENDTQQTTNKKGKIAFKIFIGGIFFYFSTIAKEKATYLEKREKILNNKA